MPDMKSRSVHSLQEGEAEVDQRMKGYLFCNIGDAESRHLGM